MKAVLTAIDFSSGSAKVVEQAALIARRFSAKLYVLHVAASDPEFIGYDVGPTSVRDFRAKGLREEHRDLEAIAAKLRDGDGELDVTPLLIQGFGPEKILSEADDVDADLIVIGSHGHGAMFHALIGSVGAGVLKKSRRPVLVVPVRGAAES